ncbi:MAG: hypothetical protein AB7V45_05610 [Candidatus Krumholzibacteriia bacterium]
MRSGGEFRGIRGIRGTRVVLRAGLVAVLCCAPARADDYSRSWLHGPEQIGALMADHRGVQAPDSLSSGAWVEAGASRLFGLPELPVATLGAGWRGRDGRLVRVDWQQTGTGIFRENRYGLTAAGNLGVRLGLTGGIRRLELAGERPRPEWSLALLVGSGWSGPGSWSGSWEFRPEIAAAEGSAGRSGRTRNLGTVRVRTKDVGLALGLDLSPDGIPECILEALFPLAGRAGILIRGTPARNLGGFGLVLPRGRLLVMTSHLIHSDLGTTHRIALVAGRWKGGAW